MCCLQHPNLLSLLEVVKENNTLYLISECLDLSLHGFIKEKQKSGGIAEIVVKNILFQLLSGLAFLHDNRFVHRDVKPENIVLSLDATKLKLIDFGLCQGQYFYRNT